MVLSALVAAGTVEAQPSLASRIDAVKNGRVRVTYAADPGVCGNGMSWFRTKGRNDVSGTVINGNWSGTRDVEPSCEHGPVRLVVVRDSGETRELRPYVGGRWKADTGITDLGAVSSREAGARRARGCCAWPNSDRTSRRVVRSRRRLWQTRSMRWPPCCALRKTRSGPPMCAAARSTGSAMSSVTTSRRHSTRSRTSQAIAQCASKRSSRCHAAQQMKPCRRCSKWPNRCRTGNCGRRRCSGWRGSRIHARWRGSSRVSPRGNPAVNRTSDIGCPAGYSVSDPFNSSFHSIGIFGSSESRTEQYFVTDRSIARSACTRSTSPTILYSS